MKKLKHVVVTWIIVYILITGLLYALNGWLSIQPIYLRTLVLSMVMVFGLQYIIFPVVNKITKSHFKR